MKRLVIIVLTTWAIVGITTADYPRWHSSYISGTDNSCKFNPNDACPTCPAANCTDSSGTCIHRRLGSDPTWLYERFAALTGWGECIEDLYYADSVGMDHFTLYVSGSDLLGYQSTSTNWNSSKTKFVRERVAELKAGQADSADAVEMCYLHFYDSTQIISWAGSAYDTGYFHGTGSLTITAADSVSRVPNSYVNYLRLADWSTYDCTQDACARLAPNFTDADVRQALKEYYCTAFDTTYDGDREADWGTRQTYDGKPCMHTGIYFDNYSILAMTGGGCVYGGHVVETQYRYDGLTVANADSLYQFGQAEESVSQRKYIAWSWHWMKEHAKEVRDTLNNGAVWTSDGEAKELEGNVGEQGWSLYYDTLPPYNAICGSASMLNPDSCGLDGLNAEFGYDPPTRHNESGYRLEKLAVRDSAFCANGGHTYWVATTFEMLPSRGGAWKGDQDSIWYICAYHEYCFALVARSDSTYFGQYGDPFNESVIYGLFVSPIWDSLRWVPPFEYDIGDASPIYELVDSGASPDYGSAHHYKILSREYTLGDTVFMIYTRPRDAAGGYIGDSLGTAVAVDLGGYYYQMDYGGQWHSGADSIATIDLSQCEGAILRPASTWEAPPVVPDTSDVIRGVTIQGAIKQ